MFYGEDLVEEVRQRNDIIDVISTYVKLQKRGNSYMGLCPFHGEKSPSFAVSPSKQMYHCFGCGVGGNVFTFLMEYENFTFVEAMKFLAERAGIRLPEEDSKEAREKADIRTQLLLINKEAGKYFYYQLKTKRGAQAYQYLTDRKLSDDTIRRFGLGYSNKTSDDLYQYLKNKSFTDDLLKESGLFTMDERGVFDKFWNRVMFPIMDVNNRIIGFGGRVMGEGTPKYLNSPETKLFDKSRNLYGLNIARMSRKKYLIICEGYMDVIALHQAGFTNAVASLGTAFTSSQANLIKRYAEGALLTYDSDEAGTRAALRAIPILKEAGLSVKVVDMEPYKDPDEFIKALGAEAFEKRLEKAENCFYFEISILEQQYDLKDPEQKTKFFNESAKKLLQFSEELERNNYIEAIANRYHISFDQLRKLVNSHGSRLVLEEIENSVYNKRRNQKNLNSEDGVKQSQKILLTWLAGDITLFSKIKEIIRPDDFIDPLYRKAAELLFGQYEKEGNVIPAKVINCFESKEEQNEAASLFHTEIGNNLTSQEMEKAFNETVIRIKQNSLEIAGRTVTEPEELQKIIKEQVQLQKLHISL